MMLSASGLRSLSSSSKVEKQKSLLKIRACFERNTQEADVILSQLLENCLKAPECTSDEVEALLLLATCVLLHAKDQLFSKVPVSVWLQLRAMALRELSEASALDVRKTSGSFVGALCKRLGFDVYQEIRDEVASRVNLVLKKCQSVKKDHPSSLEAGVTPQSNWNENTITDPKNISSSTSAWKLLDTWLYTFMKVAQGCGSDFCGCIDLPLVHCLQESINNDERFIRESCCVLIKCLVDNCGFYAAFGGRKRPPESSSIFEAVVKVHHCFFLSQKTALNGN